MVFFGCRNLFFDMRILFNSVTEKDILILLVCDFYSWEDEELCRYRGRFP